MAFRKPGVVQGVVKVQPLVGVRDEEAGYEVFGVFGDHLPVEAAEAVLARHCVLHYGLHVAAAERKLTR